MCFFSLHSLFVLSTTISREKLAYFVFFLIPSFISFDVYKKITQLPYL